MYRQFYEIKDNHVLTLHVSTLFFDKPFFFIKSLHYFPIIIAILIPDIYINLLVSV